MGKSKKKSRKDTKSETKNESVEPEKKSIDKKADTVTAENSRSGALEDYYTLGGSIQMGVGAQESETVEGVDKADNSRWAVKIIKKAQCEDLEALMREIDIMRKLNHNNCLRLREVFEDAERVVLVTEIADGGELFDRIIERGAYSEADAAHIILQALEGVHYLHSNGIAHRDLKPENLLVAGSDEKPLIKISDFGLSKQFGGAAGRLATSCGTPDYVAPEVLRGAVYDESVDLWSLGVIAYILLCGFPPFWGDNQGQLFDRILSCEFDFPDPEWTEVSDEAKDFIKKLLVAESKDRLNSEQALAHPWIQTKGKEGKEGTAGTEMRSLDTNAKLTEYAAKRKEGL